MLVPNLMLFYVKNPQESALFYERIFEQKPASSFPTFVSFSFANGLNFAVWSTESKDFVSEGSGHRSEIAFMVPNEQEIRRLPELWGKMGVRIEQDLMQATFGLTFVANDPDGHRIRVCVPDRG